MPYPGPKEKTPIFSEEKNDSPEPIKEQSLAEKIALEIKRGGNDYLNGLFSKFDEIKDATEKEKVLEEITNSLQGWDIEEKFIQNHWSFSDSSADSSHLDDAKKIADFFLKHKFINEEQRERFEENCNETWKKLKKES